MLDNKASSEIRAAELWLDDTTTQARSIAELATYLGYSESHIRRHFLRCFGMGPARYRNTLRLERAASLLLRTSRRVIDIAESCGFRSHAIFSRAFHHHFGTSPTRFRRRHGRPTILPKASRLDVRVTTCPTISLWSIRHYGYPAPQSLPQLWERHRSHHAWGMRPLPDGIALLLPDDPAITPRHRQRIDIGFQGTTAWPPSPYHRRLTCPETLAASLTFDDLSLLPSLHAYLLDHWLPDQSLDYTAAPARVIRDERHQRFDLLLPLGQGSP
ncbi:helix-turn-helix domain-containing protein [Halomonas sp. 328]|uniref:helix-turn-helix domain-containing protein n=1 Tax=Halomonas sp. 328 TaxID=2776704 RepID=UPI0018A72339|nr:helix-turn-helix domain-containing protein [Halomonas sp. 328]MBF8221309.1 AraC family transcriptional regulator [Halomonas sp. 328]